MGFEVYEDPMPHPTTNSMLSGSSCKPLPSGRTPLGKRTNQGSAVDNNGMKKGIEKQKISHPTHIQESAEKRGVKTHRHVHFSDIPDGEVLGNESRATRVVSSPLNELRQKLRVSPAQRGALTPATPALAQRRTSTMSPSTLLRTEMDSTPDDSFMLVSPRGQQGPSVTTTRSSLIPLTRLGRGRLLGKPQRVVATTANEATDTRRKATDEPQNQILSQSEKVSKQPPRPTDCDIHTEQTKPLPSKGSVRKTSHLLSKRIPQRGAPPKPIGRPGNAHCARGDKTVASLESTNLDSPRMETQTLPRIDRETTANTGQSGAPPKSPSAHLAKKIPLQKAYHINQKTTIGSVAKSIKSSCHPIERTLHSTAKVRTITTSEQQEEFETKSSESIPTDLSSNKQADVLALQKLHISTQLSPNVAMPEAPLTQTTQFSAWKDVHTNALTNSPMPSTPRGICLDLSNMFQKAHTSRPPTAAKSKPLQLSQSIHAPVVNTVTVTPAVLATQAQQQCEMFTTWLNATLCPDDDVHVENDPWRGLALHQRMAKVRQRAQVIWQSEEMIKIRDVLEREIVKGRLQIRPDRDMYADLNQRKTILELLIKSYETPWLRLGLETLFGQAIEPGMQSKSPSKNRLDLRPMGKSTLSRMQVTLRDFIVNRVIFDAAVLAKYTKGKCKVPSGQFEKDYKDEMRTLILYRIMVLFFFLDQAKRENLLEQTLFRRKSTQKSSKQMLGEFCRMFLASTGDIAKQLAKVGLRVYHVQEPLDEVNFTVQNIATDLRDGIRLGRLAEILTSSTYQSLLKELRIPAVSRLPKFTMSILSWNV